MTNDRRKIFFFCPFLLKTSLSFLMALCLCALCELTPTLLFPGRSVSRTYFLMGTNSSSLSSKPTRNKPALVWKPDWRGVHSKLKCSVSHPAQGRASSEFVHWRSFQIPADPPRVWAERERGCCCHRNAKDAQLTQRLHVCSLLVSQFCLLGTGILRGLHKYSFQQLWP